MKKSIVLFLTIICVLFLTACNTKSMNYIIENKPSVTGIVEEVHDDYIIMYSETAAGYPNETRWQISLEVKNKDSYTDITVGDEIVVYYDGMAAETSPLQVGTVYAITLKTPAKRTVDEESGVDNSKVEVVNLKEFGNPKAVLDNVPLVSNVEVKKSNEDELQIEFALENVGVCTFVASKGKNLSLPNETFIDSTKIKWTAQTADDEYIFPYMKANETGDIFMIDWTYKEFHFAIYGKSPKNTSDRDMAGKIALEIIQNLGADTTNIKIDYGASSIYTKAEMDAAIELIKKEFSTWDGCELHSISYSTDEECSESNIAWMNEMGKATDVEETFTQCIMFKSNFHSPLNGGSGFNPDEEYTDWQWWLARSEGGQWKLMTYGY